MKKICAVLAAIFILINQLNTLAITTGAKAAILINAHTGEVLYSINQNQRLPMASTTKIMTALLLCEYNKPQKEITVTEEMVRVEGSSMGLLPGDKVTLNDLLYGLMLASGNDAANVTAYAVSGSITEFVGLMNKRARELNLKNTSFATPSGLDSAEHYSSAEDMARLAAVALRNEDFAKAVATKTAVLNYGNPPYRRSLTNHNKLLNMYEGAVGVKTGYTKKSGRCLVSAAERDGQLLIAVTLNDPDDWSDHKKMFDYGFSATQTKTIFDRQSFEIPVVGGKSESLTVNIEPYQVSGRDFENYSYEVNLPAFLYAPIHKGECLGEIIYKKNGERVDLVEIKSEETVAATPVKKNILDNTKELYRYIFMKIWEN